MDDDVGAAVAIGHGLAERQAHDLAAGDARAHDHRLRTDAGGVEGAAEPEIEQDVGGVGGKLQAGADFRKLGGALEHDNALTRPGEAHRQRQTADSGADHHHGLMARHGM